MRRTAVMASVLGVVAVGLMTASLVVYYDRPTVLRVAVSGTDVEDHDLIGAAAKLLKHGHHSLRFKLVETDGVASAASALDAKEADLAVVRPDIAMPTSGETVVLLHKDTALLLAPDGSDIEKINDLKGKRIGVLSQRPGDERLLDAVLAQYDLADSDITRLPLSLDGVESALAGKSVDAVYVVGRVSGDLLPAVVKAVVAAGHGAPVFLPVAEAPAVAERLPAFQSVEILKGAFGGTPPRPADDVEALGVSYQLVASSDLAQGVVGTLTRFLLSERVALAQIAPVARRMEAPSTDKGGAIPVHPGTAAYIDDEEESFLERYSDFIYIGAMVLGVAASGLTALLGRFGQPGSVRVEDLIARLLQIYKDGRTAPSLAALDILEEEIDAVVADALDERCMRGLDERRVAALTLAVEQARAGVRDRRSRLARAGLRPANDEVVPFDASAAFPAYPERSLEG